jgi:hypothetical protein
LRENPLLADALLSEPSDSGGEEQREAFRERFAP